MDQDQDLLNKLAMEYQIIHYLCLNLRPPLLQVIGQLCRYLITCITELLAIVSMVISSWTHNLAQASAHLAYFHFWAWCSNSPYVKADLGPVPAGTKAL